MREWIIIKTIFLLVFQGNLYNKRFHFSCSYFCLIVAIVKKCLEKKLKTGILPLPYNELTVINCNQTNGTKDIWLEKSEQSSDRSHHEYIQTFMNSAIYSFLRVLLAFFTNLFLFFAKSWISNHFHSHARKTVFYTQRPFSIVLLQ